MASYPYERLNPESFQELSQSLLLKAYPGLQCFPVGQPDGGRDGIVRSFRTAGETPAFILFQVKFVRRELNPSEARKWLLKTLRHELPKVQRLVSEGAQEFVLVTNVRGTAHHKHGSIDELQALLEEHIPIPAQAWWRDDLDRRLDGASDLKFTYPGLLSGMDLLRLIVEMSPSEDRERRSNAIRAFLSHQFASDREVKFKQAELENNVFDLFTDVPLIPLDLARASRKEQEQLLAVYRRAATSESGDVDPLELHHWLGVNPWRESNIGNIHLHNNIWIGAASLLLDRDFQEVEPFVIIEGAPGQGKSTIAQYICQIHRTRILGHRLAASLAYVHRNSALRLPLKAELRDFATWLSGGNPFGTRNDHNSRHTSSKSLEGFLSALIRDASGGAEFNVSDLHTTLRSVPSLIVLDGLDEVVEVSQRRRVAEAISSAIPRLKSLAKSLQVVVTSRPSPFINSPVLPRRFFATYSLEALTIPLITEYSKRWLQSKAADQQTTDDVRQILNNKLSEPHLHALARNPMQLAILLSLIHRKGASLPDKRTALYDDYIAMFFDRESEKVKMVKENRDLLIRIHRYLAWVLQSSVEVDSNTITRTAPSGVSHSGTIAGDDLRDLVLDFLKREGSDVTLVDELFTGMVERVVAIVSRVQGLYEFDVQTLREYFAARYLYETAQYSPTGAERRGTKSDRWYALSRNYYWMNVVRFYAGCYSEGELASLIDELASLRSDQLFRSRSHPQLLTAALLGDYVFSQKPRAVQAAVNLLVEPRALQLLLAGMGSGLGRNNEVVVSESEGRKRLIAAVKELVGPDQPFERIVDIVQCLLRPNCEPAGVIDWWVEELCTAAGTDIDHWCAVGQLLGCWSVIDLETVTDVRKCGKVPLSDIVVGLLLAGRMDLLECDEELFDGAVDRLLAGEWLVPTRNGSLLGKVRERDWTDTPASSEFTAPPR